MKGVAKYDALFQVNLKEEFKHLFEVEPVLSCLKGVPISFLNDVSGFAIGECALGKNKKNYSISVLQKLHNLEKNFLKKVK